jgi:hypothetical protein
MPASIPFKQEQEMEFKTVRAQSLSSHWKKTRGHQTVITPFESNIEHILKQDE